MQLPEFKVRASAAGKLTTKPRKKTDLISQTTISYVDQWIIEQLYGIKKDISSKYLEKGIRLEDDGISKAIEWLDIPFAVKNEKYFEDDHFCGTPDMILPEEIIDIKLSWDAFTFPILKEELPDKDYYYQLQVYMHLTGKRTGRVVYLLLNTPDDIDKYGPRYDYSKMPKDMRIKTYRVDYDPGVIEYLKGQVSEIRKYIESKIKI